MLLGWSGARPGFSRLSASSKAVLPGMEGWRKIWVVVTHPTRPNGHADIAFSRQGSQNPAWRTKIQFICRYFCRFASRNFLTRMHQCRYQPMRPSAISPLADDWTNTSGQARIALEAGRFQKILTLANVKVVSSKRLLD